MVWVSHLTVIDLLLHLVLNVHRFEFESRKDVVQIFNSMLRRQIGSRYGLNPSSYALAKPLLLILRAIRWPTVEYLSTKHDVIFGALKVGLRSSNVYPDSSHV
jgi:calcium binding protein 39